jgi:hypothetical protein
MSIYLSCRCLRSQLARILLTLTLLHGLILTNLVRNRTATSTSSAANQSTLTSTQQTTNYGTAHRRAANNLGTGMLLMVFGGLLTLRTLMLRFLVLSQMIRSQLTILRLTHTGKSETQHSCQHSTRNNRLNLHGRYLPGTFLLSNSMLRGTLKRLAQRNKHLPQLQIGCLNTVDKQVRQITYPSCLQSNRTRIHAFRRVRSPDINSIVTRLWPIYGGGGGGTPFP